MLRNSCVSCWDVRVPCTCTHVQSYGTAHVLSACTHVGCYARVGVGVGWDVITFVTHEHMFNATQQLRFLLGCSCSLHLHTCSKLRNCSRSFGLHTCWMLRKSWGWGGIGCDNIRYTWTHVQCYATAAFLAGMFTFPALAHMFKATELLTFFRLAHMLDATQELGLGWCGDDQVAESHTAVLKKQLRRNNKLAGLTPRGAHIAGLSAVHIHRNLGFEKVLQCFTKYIHQVGDSIPPASAFVDQTWLQS